jgi:hypothetical protein
MSERLAQLAGSTLVSDYRPGAGAITVESVARFPVAPFTCAIADRETEKVKLLFAVTATSGETLLGAAAGTDVSANIGDLVLAPVIRSFQRRFVFEKRW